MTVQRYRVELTNPQSLCLATGRAERLGITLGLYATYAAAAKCAARYHADCPASGRRAVVYRGDVPLGAAADPTAAYPESL